MQNCHPAPHSLEGRLVLVALGIILCANVSSLAQPAVRGPVEELRLTLSAPVSDPAKRDWDLKERIAALQSLGDLRRALILREWRDEDKDPKVAAVDRANRLVMAQCFEQAVRNVLTQGDETSRLAMLSMLAEMGTTAHGVGTKRGIARDLAGDLVKLIKQGEPGCCAAALRTLAQIDPEPEVALPGFSGSLCGADVNERLAAAEGLVCWMRTAAQLAMLDSRPNGVELTRSDFVAVAWASIPLAARGLRAHQPEIRRRSAEAIGYAATALHNWVLAAPATVAADDPDPGRTEERVELLPLFLALQDQRSALTHALLDADAEVRFRADRALEDMTIPRQVFSQDASHLTQGGEKPPAEIVRTSNFVATSSPPQAEIARPLSLVAPSPPLEADGIPGTVDALAAQLLDPDAKIRRVAVEDLESRGQNAAPATAQLLGALGDPDKFVRWAAVRTLGRMRPVGEELIVPGFCQLLTDPDLDVRLAVATALERWGAAAHAAAPDLRRTVGATDAELRLAAIRALAAIGGPEVREAIPEITAALADPDVRVRMVAAQVLGNLGPDARDAVSALCWAVKDDHPGVQKAAGAALLNILRPATE
jgi:HEAT repeats